MSLRNIPITRDFTETSKDGVTCTYLATLHSTREPAIVRPSGEAWWYVNGKLHRDNDKPAYTSPDGRKAWFQHGVVHRDGGPAETAPNGRMAYYQQGKLHREDGPAIIDPRKGNEWWIHGRKKLNF